MFVEGVWLFYVQNHDFQNMLFSNFNITETL